MAIMGKFPTNEFSDKELPVWYGVVMFPATNSQITNSGVVSVSIGGRYIITSNPKSVVIM